MDESARRGAAGFWNRLSILCCALAGTLLWLLFRELPHRDLLPGRFMALFHLLLGDGTGGEPELRATPMLAMTEPRVLTLLYACIWLFALASILTGLRARARAEHSLGHAGPIVLSLGLMFVAWRLRYLVEW